MYVRQFMHASDCVFWKFVVSKILLLWINRGWKKNYELFSSLCVKQHIIVGWKPLKLFFLSSTFCQIDLGTFPFMYFYLTLSLYRAVVNFSLNFTHCPNFYLHVVTWKIVCRVSYYHWMAFHIFLCTIFIDFLVWEFNRWFLIILQFVYMFFNIQY